MNPRPMDADSTGKKEVPESYEILRSIAFVNNRGFALAENPNAPSSFVTWQFTESDSGKRDYYWGHYVSSKEKATKDYEKRIDAYTQDYGIAEKDAYRYYSTRRPVDIGAFPKPADNAPLIIVNFDTREPVEQGGFQAWGYLVYDAPLSREQIGDYELRAAPNNPDVKTVMREQAQTVGAWEDMVGLAGPKRFTWHRPSIQAYDLREPMVSPEQWEQRYRFAYRELNAAIKTTPAQKRIAEQLAEAGKQVEHNTDAQAKNKNKSHEDR